VDLVQGGPPCLSSYRHGAATGCPSSAKNSCPPPRSLRQAHLSPLEQEYAVSPNSPLLSTTVQNNAWVCGAFFFRQRARAAYCIRRRCPPTLLCANAVSEAHPPTTHIHDTHTYTGDNGHGQLGISGTQSVAVPQAIQVRSARSTRGGRVAAFVVVVCFFCFVAGEAEGMHKTCRTTKNRRRAGGRPSR
jgi:hypothetical protein